jgi:very-short-patch-repair endonuclease
VFRGVYAPRGTSLTAADKAVAAWLWSRRRATVAGVSAAALHGSLWIDAHLPAELNQASQHRTAGIVLRADALARDDVTTVRGIPTTTPARTAFDLGRRGELATAVVRLDALMRATDLKSSAVDALVQRHRGARGVVQLRRALELADAGAESPQETRVRLRLVSAGLPTLHTQVEVYDRHGSFVARLDIGWPRWRVAVEYDGAQHWTDGRQRTRDIDRHAELEALEWRIVRVSADMLRNRPWVIVERTRRALLAAGCPI